MHRIDLHLADPRIHNVSKFLYLRIADYAFQLDFDKANGEPSFAGFPSWLEPLFVERFSGNYKFNFDQENRYYYLEFPTEEDKLLFALTHF